MIKFNTITNAVRDRLLADQGVYDLLETSENIYIGEYINVNPGNTPWIGIYRESSSHRPELLGAGVDWKMEGGFKLVVQETSDESGEDCEIRLENLIDKVVSAMFADKTLGGVIDSLNALDIEYGYIETEMDSIYFQSAILSFNFEVQT